MKNSVYWLMGAMFIVLGLSVLAPALIAGRSLSEMQFAAFSVACAFTFLSGLKLLFAAWERKLAKSYPHEVVHPHRSSSVRKHHFE